MPSPATKTADGKKSDEAPKIEGPKAETAKPTRRSRQADGRRARRIKELPEAEQAAATPRPSAR